ncbi:unnamed protein product [Amoebophrya sp. A120]|nr:unnamed protein product [Amoebophrya sp. A120]|eukprot:GSA120T00002753001.1
MFHFVSPASKLWKVAERQHKDPAVLAATACPPSGSNGDRNQTRLCVVAHRAERLVRFVAYNFRLECGVSENAVPFGFPNAAHAAHKACEQRLVCVNGAPQPNDFFVSPGDVVSVPVMDAAAAFLGNNEGSDYREYEGLLCFDLLVDQHNKSIGDGRGSGLKHPDDTTNANAARTPLRRRMMQSAQDGTGGRSSCNSDKDGEHLVHEHDVGVEIGEPCSNLDAYYASHPDLELRAQWRKASCEQTLDLPLPLTLRENTTGPGCNFVIGNSRKQEPSKQALATSMHLDTKQDIDSKVKTKNSNITGAAHTPPVLDNPELFSFFQKSSLRFQVQPSLSPAELYLRKICGEVCQQEIASMAPVQYLLDGFLERNSNAKLRILDLCAAPGSKTCQLLEEASKCATDFVVVANDVCPYRCEQLLQRAKQLHPELCKHLVVTCADAATTNFGADQFDLVLCDVPCSSEGTVRKNQNKRQKWSPQQAARHTKLQEEIFRNGCRHVRNGGRIVYSTCAMNTMENEEVVRNVLERNRARATSEKVVYERVGKGSSAPIRLWPSRQTGGFFLTVLAKRGEALDASSCGARTCVNVINADSSTGPETVVVLPEHKFLQRKIQNTVYVRAQVGEKSSTSCVSCVSAAARDMLLRLKSAAQMNHDCKLKIVGFGVPAWWYTERAPDLGEGDFAVFDSLQGAWCYTLQGQRKKNYPKLNVQFCQEACALLVSQPDALSCFGNRLLRVGGSKFLSKFDRFGWKGVHFSFDEVEVWTSSGADIMRSSFMVPECREQDENANSDVSSRLHGLTGTCILCVDNDIAIIAWADEALETVIPMARPQLLIRAAQLLRERPGLSYGR